MLSLRLSVCSFDHGGFLRTFWELAWGLLGSILGAWGVAWAPFWGLWAPLGLHFGGLGPPWASFLGLWGFSGAFGAPWVAPLAAQGAQSEIFPLFSPPFLAHFRYILELKTDEKCDMILDAFFDWIWVVFWLIFSIILERFWIDFYIFREFAKTRKIAPRSSESTKIKGLGSRTWHQNQKKTHRNLLQNLKRKIIPKWSQNGGKMESKWSQKGIKKSMFF